MTDSGASEVRRRRGELVRQRALTGTQTDRFAVPRTPGAREKIRSTWLPSSVMPIVPDAKDWTWVLERRCDECGFDSSTFPREHVAPLIRESARAWHEVMSRTTRLRDRPSDDRWSALEYACHVRDVFRLYDERLQLLLAQDDPTFANWDQDATAVDDRYNEQDPSVVASEISEAAAALADRFDAVDGKSWHRTGMRSDGARFTIDTFARYLVHDPVHHLHDVAAL